MRKMVAEWMAEVAMNSLNWYPAQSKPDAGRVHWLTQGTAKGRWAIQANQNLTGCRVVFGIMPRSFALTSCTDCDVIACSLGQQLEALVGTIFRHRAPVRNIG
ncbi:hypothetical protein BaRGS_00031726 [Batillaria attramentaria]|uniref:Uncharacterized protein n=1 Tax=Batillaria attramentaria TaxID=370345 RepID=A0ABD0JQM3_9CAEN